MILKPQNGDTFTQEGQCGYSSFVHALFLSAWPDCITLQSGQADKMHKTIKSSMQAVEKNSMLWVAASVSPVWEFVQSCWWSRWWPSPWAGRWCCRCRLGPRRRGGGKRSRTPRPADPAACSRRWGRSTREGGPTRSRTPGPKAHVT